MISVRSIIFICIIGSLSAATLFSVLKTEDLFDPSNVDSLDGILQQKIVNGKPIDISKMPWLVSLQRENIHRCGGSLLTPTHVVTAAHCTFTHKASDFTIRAGSTFLDQPKISRKVLKITNHPDYKDGSYDYDIAIMELDSPILENTKTIPLASKIPADNASITIGGWGDLKENATVWNSNQLLFIDIFVVNRNRCQEIIGERDGVLTARMFCAWAQGKDACVGDSGGPVVDKDGRICGIVSWAYGCAYENVPGMYTDIPVLAPWIKTVIPTLK